MSALSSTTQFKSRSSLKLSLTHFSGDNINSKCHILTSAIPVYHELSLLVPRTATPTLLRPAVVTYSSWSPQGKAQCLAHSRCWVVTGVNGYCASNFCFKIWWPTNVKSVHPYVTFPQRAWHHVFCCHFAFLSSVNYKASLQGLLRSKLGVSRGGEKIWVLPL